MKIKQGMTRIVFLVGDKAYKIPNFTKGWKLFLYGFLSNMQEVEYSGRSSAFCPVLFSLPFGLLVVMPRVEPILEIHDAVYKAIISDVGDYPRIQKEPTSFGLLDRSLVIVDYGTAV